MNEQLIKELIRSELAARFDANETAFLARQIEFVRTKVYEVQYAELLAKRFMPLATDIPASAETYVYYVYDVAGRAKVIAHATDDLPRVDAQAAERTGKVRTVGDSYGWDINSMREAARVQLPLTDMKARAARRAIETTIDEMLFNGRDSTQPAVDWGVTGIANNPDVAAQGLFNPTNDPWTMTTDPALILGDMNGFVSSVVTASNQRWIPDTLLFAPREFEIIAQKPVGVDNQMTILRSFLANNPYIRNVDQWYRLTGAGGGGTNRAICYARSPDVLEGVMPMDFEQLAPQARNLEFVVPCQGRVGGVKVYQPAAMRYADFATA